jgi:putative transposase
LFDAFQATGIRNLRSAVWVPRRNVICERLVGTPSPRGPGPRADPRGLRAVRTEYRAHCNTVRPHQGIGQNVPDGERDAPRATTTDVGSERIRRKPVLGGLINEYSHTA